MFRGSQLRCSGVAVLSLSRLAAGSVGELRRPFLGFHLRIVWRGRVGGLDLDFAMTETKRIVGGGKGVWKRRKRCSSRNETDCCLVAVGGFELEQK